MDFEERYVEYEKVIAQPIPPGMNLRQGTFDAPKWGKIGLSVGGRVTSYKLSSHPRWWGKRLLAWVLRRRDPRPLQITGFELREVSAVPDKPQAFYQNLMVPTEERTIDSRMDRAINDRCPLCDNGTTHTPKEHSAWMKGWL